MLLANISWCLIFLGGLFLPYDFSTEEFFLQIFLQKENGRRGNKWEANDEKGFESGKTGNFLSIHQKGNV